MISKGQGLLLNSDHPGCYSPWHSISPVPQHEGVCHELVQPGQQFFQFWPSFEPPLEVFFSMLRRRRRKLSGNYCRVFSHSDRHSITVGSSARLVENDADSTNIYWVSTMYKTSVRYQGFKVELDFLPAFTELIVWWEKIDIWRTNVKML